MLLRLPGFGTVDADGEHAERLLAAGWERVKATKPAPKKRAPKKTPKATE